GPRPAGASGGGLVVRVDARENAQQDGRVRHTTRHRAGGVLTVGDRNDPDPAHETERRLDPHDAAAGGGRDDRAVGLGSDRYGTEIGGDSNARAGARSRRRAIERIRVAALTAPPAAPARRMSRA